MLDHFTKLETWKLAHQTVLLIYKFTEQFPEKEKFSLTSQIRRASISITSNIAEGFGRFNQKEKRQFYLISKSSLAEVQSQLYIARDLKYLSEKHFTEIDQQLVIVDKHLANLIKKLQ